MVSLILLIPQLWKNREVFNRDRRYIVNSYGEILDELSTGDKIIRKASLDNFKSYSGKKILKDKELQDRGYIAFKPYKFITSNEEEGRLLLDELSVDERSFLFSIHYYVGYDNYLKLPNNKKMSTNDIISVSGFKKSKVYSLLKSLDDKCIIKKIKTAKNTVYVLNPWVFHKGAYINQNLVKVFGDYKIRCKGLASWNSDNYC